MDCLGIVLAGGLSSRMGENKAFLSLKNQTMLDLSQQLLRSAGLNNVVISGENSGGEKDIVHQGGPLAGIYTLIKKYNPRAILAVPVDMPFLTTNHLKELKLKGELSAKATYFNRSSLPIYLPVNALVSQYLEQTFNSAEFIKTGKGPSFKHVLNMTNALSIANKDQHAFINTNTPEQWANAKQIIN